MNPAEWEKKGTYVRIQGHKVFVYDSGGNKQTICILHGYPTSSLDYHKVIPILEKKYRVIVHDHLGFGFSEKPQKYSYSLMEQADIALLLWQYLKIKSAHLVAHDYGTSVATEIIARRNMSIEPVKLLSLTLCNGSVHIELAKLRLIQKLLRNKLIGPLIARLSTKRVFARNMKQLWYDKSKLDQEDLDAMWEMLIYNNGKTVLAKITQYLRDRVIFWHRWVGGLIKTDINTNILWGENDPITGAKVAKVHHSEMKNSKLILLAKVGHYPMLEAPERWAQLLLEALKK